MNIPSILLLVLIAAAFLAVVITSIRRKKKGHSGCSCGGSCDGCGMNCHEDRKTHHP